MNGLIKEIEDLKQSKTKEIIDNRIREFKKINKNSNEELFSEMCFCILTANYNAEKTIKIQNEIGNSFCEDSKDALCEKLKEYGHRFPNARADYIMCSRIYKNNLSNLVNNNNYKIIREWIVKNIKGLGLKEASHFLRNIGFDDYAIIDFHIIDLLVKYGIIKRPKSLTKNKYLEIEETLREIGKKTNLTLAELDLYLWYMETGKILK